MEFASRSAVATHELFGNSFFRHFGDADACISRKEGIPPSTRMVSTTTIRAHQPTEHKALPPEEVIFGRTGAMLALRNQLEKVCGANIPVLIQGAGGSGKEILAHWIHQQSPWGSGPFVKVNFAAIPGNILESELFGYRAGAFTGAASDRTGRVELAQGGTLFLDQITDLDSSFQAKLLQLLQDGRFTRLGDHEERRVEARVICASSWRLKDAVREGKFRQDLYYRLNVFEVILPTLSERKGDIPLIAHYLLRQLNARYQREASPLDSSKLRHLQNMEWRGNIREMENWISRYVLLGEETFPDDSGVGKYFRSQGEPEVSQESISLKSITRQARRAVSRDLIFDALQSNRWNRRKAAKDLKISYRTMLHQIQELGLSLKRLKKPGDRALGKTDLPTSSSDQ
jgi:DNA-binding NtrC family response regulator